MKTTYRLKIATHFCYTQTL